MPLLKLPKCDTCTVEQTEDARARILGVDDGVERIDELSDEYQVNVKLAVQGWIGDTE